MSALRRGRLAMCSARSVDWLVGRSTHVKSLASHVLSQIARRIDADWQGRYGHPLHLLETFVQQDRFAGTCYRAANWIHVGRTTGRTRQDRHNRVNAPFKEIYLYPLTAHARRDLCR